MVILSHIGNRLSHSLVEYCWRDYVDREDNGKMKEFYVQHAIGNKKCTPQKRRKKEGMFGIYPSTYPCRHLEERKVWVGLVA